MIYKKPGERDRRSFLVFSTELGRRVIAETTPIEDEVTAEVKRCISETEYDAMMELLVRIQRHIGDKLEHPDDSEN